MKKILATLAVLCFGAGFCFGQDAALDVLQRRFVDLRFGARRRLRVRQHRRHLRTRHLQ